MERGEIIEIIKKCYGEIDCDLLEFHGLESGIYGYFNNVIFYKNIVFKINNGHKKTEKIGISKELADEYVQELKLYYHAIAQKGVYVPKVISTQVIELKDGSSGIFEVQQRIFGETMIYRLMNDKNVVSSFKTIMKMVRLMKSDIGKTVGFDIQFGNFVIDENEDCYFVDFFVPRVRGGIEEKEIKLNKDRFKMSYTEHRYYSYLGILFFLHGIYSANNNKYASVFRSLLVRQLKKEGLFEEYKKFIQKPELHKELEHSFDNQRLWGVPIEFDQSIEKLVFNYT